MSTFHYFILPQILLTIVANLFFLRIILVTFWLLGVKNGTVCFEEAKKLRQRRFTFLFPSYKTQGNPFAA